jgi:hypothetical protein
MARWTMRSIVAVILTLLVSSSSWAKDVYADQIWFRGSPNSTFQHWQFTTPDQFNVVPETYMNPYGTPQADINGVGAEWSDAWPAPPILEPDGDVPGWHMPQGGTVFYLLHNNPLPNAKKIIIAQVTSSKEPLSVSLDLPVGFSYSMFDTGLPPVEWGLPAPFDGSWCTYVYGFEVVGNPESECIRIDYPPCTTLDQTILDTVCIPEPSALVLLAGGLMALLAYHWRKQR